MVIFSVSAHRGHAYLLWFGKGLNGVLFNTLNFVQSLRCEHAWASMSVRASLESIFSHLFQEPGPEEGEAEDQAAAPPPRAG